MSEKRSRVKLGEPARYQIQVQGRFDEGWSDHFEGMTLLVEDGSAITRLEGVVQDQSVLFGLLLQIRDLGLPLLLVRWVDER